MKNKSFSFINRVTSYLIIFTMVIWNFGMISLASAAAIPTLTIGSLSASNGATINVPIDASNFGSSVAGMDFSVQYDPALLTFDGYTQNAISGHGILTVNNPSGNTIIANWFDTVALAIDSGTIITLNFTVISSATTNANLNFAGTLELTDSTGTTITPSSFVDGVISLNPAKAITSFDFVEGGVGVINEGAKTIAVTVPYGTDVTLLTPNIAVSAGASVSPLSGVVNDFTTPQTYTVTAADSTTQNYTVTVTVAPNNAKAITTFDFASPATTGVVNESIKIVSLTVPYGTDVTALVPTIAISGSSISPLSGVAQDFTGPVSYTVTAADASTQIYVVTVTVALNPAKAITSFDFASPATTGVVNESAKTVSLTVPYGTDVTALVPTIGITGASVNPTSNAANDFTSPATYIVTAADGTTQAYVVTVNFAAPSNIATITSSTYTVSTGGTANETITNVPYGVSSSTFLANLSKSEANQTWDSTGISDPVVSGDTLVVTAQDGSTIVTYTITAALNPAKAITSFTTTSPTATGTIDEASHTIVMNVPSGTAITAVTPTIVISGSSVTPLTGVVQDFTTPVVYTVTAEDSSTQTYTASFTFYSTGGGGGGVSGCYNFPTGSFKIDDGAKVTNTSNVIITIQSNNATEVIVSEDPYFIGASYQSISDSLDFVLSDGDGEKTIYMLLKNSCGYSTNLSNVITVDSGLSDGNPEVGVDETLIPTPPTSELVGEVLGDKVYADGSLIRGSDNKIYVIVGQYKKYISNLSELSAYGGQEIFNVNDSVLDSYPDLQQNLQQEESNQVDPQALVVGTLIRGTDKRIYEILDDGLVHHILTLDELREKYFGVEVINLPDEILVKYL